MIMMSQGRLQGDMMMIVRFCAAAPPPNSGNPHPQTHHMLCFAT